jgi:FimV-like protein
MSTAASIPVEHPTQSPTQTPTATTSISSQSKDAGYSQPVVKPESNVSKSGQPASGLITSTNSASKPLKPVPADESTFVKAGPATHAVVDYPTLVSSGEAKTEAASGLASDPTTRTAGSAPTSRSKPQTTSAQTDDNKTDEETGGDSYSKESLKISLVRWKKEMNSTDSRTRYYAMVMVAKCYADLGDKAKAQELLQQVIDNGPGPERRQARKALRKIK